MGLWADLNVQKLVSDLVNIHQRKKFIKKTNPKPVEYSKTDTDWEKLNRLGLVNWRFNKNYYYRGAYMGFNEKFNMAIAPKEQGLLIVAPTQSGKTLKLIEPNIMLSPSATVVTSIKNDVIQHTKNVLLQQGREIFVFDPDNTEVEIENTTKIRWSPLETVKDWNTARLTAQRMVEPNESKDSDANKFFYDQAKVWLGCILYACHLGKCGISDLYRMTVRAENEQIQKQIRTLLASDTADSIPLDTYESIFDIEQKTRQNILADMQLSVSIYADKNAQEQASDVNFNIENFINSNGVLFITSPVDKQKLYAPLIAVFLENIRQAIYKRYARFQQGELTAEPFPVFFILDEVANTAPIPLLNIISEAGGQGLHIIAVLQDLNQAEKQWGILGRGILSHFPNKLLLNGISDADTVSGISIIQGEYDQQFITQSVGLQGITNNYQIRKERNLKPDQIAHIPPNQALHLTKGGYEYLNLYAVYESPFNTIRNKYAQ